MSMDYFRRPQLAGNNITRSNYAVIRGSLRRTDADGSSTVPYFPGATSGKTLLVSVNGASAVTITLTDTSVAGSSLVNALADINTALNPGATAFDTDGTITLRSESPVGGSSIEVTGGNAAALLGFNLSLGRILSIVGEELSTPEGRVGNPFGTAFPDRGEALSAESVNRGLARLAANADVLLSEHLRADTLPRKTTFTTSDGKYLTPTPSSTRAFTGLGLLSASSTKTELAPFFFLVDQATGLPPSSRVVGVVRGSPAGLPPYADATSWTGGGSTGNVLGVDLSKSSLAITSISDGRVIECSSASFITTAKVVPGDYVEITGATNVAPWSNNGYRWVVEEVITETTLAVRPMSKSEMTQFGPVTSEVRPITELNGKKVGLETYGTAIVHNGTYCNDVKVVVDPAIPTGATYDLYVATPGDLRSKKVHEDASADIMRRYLGTDYRPLPNALLTPPTVSTWSSSSVALTSGLARFNGRLVNIPALTFANTVFSTTYNGGINYIYWDQERGEVLVTQSPVKVFNVPTTGRANAAFNSDTPKEQFLIAVVTKTGSNITAAVSAGRTEAQQVREITVGATGQFTKLEDAINHINTWETQQSTNGSYIVYNDRYSQFEIVLTSDVTVVGNLPTITVAYLRIRGARPDVTLTMSSMTTSTPINFWPGQGTVGGQLLFEDLVLSFDTTAAGYNLVSQPSSLSSGTSNFSFKNVQVVGTTPGTATFNWLVSGANLGNVFMADCTVQSLKKGLVQSNSATAYVHIDRCSVTLDLAGPAISGVQIISNSSGITNDWTGVGVHIEASTFYSFGTDQGITAPILGRFNAQVICTDVTFSDGTTLPTLTDSLLISANAAAFVVLHRCRTITGLGAVSRAIIDSIGPRTFVQDCAFVATGHGCLGAQPTLRVGVLEDSQLLVTDPGVGSPNVGVSITRLARNNIVSGAMLAGIANTSAAAVWGEAPTISGNRIDIQTLPYTGVPVQGIIASSHAQSKAVVVESNFVNIVGAGSVGILAKYGANGLSNGRIIGNYIRTPGAAGNNGFIGIDLRDGINCSVIGNNLIGYGGPSSTGQIGVLLGNGGANSVLGNNIAMDSGGTGISLGAAEEDAFRISDNHVSSSGAALTQNVLAMSNIAAVISDNLFEGNVSGIQSCSFIGNYVGGTFATATASYDPVAISGNYFDGHATFYGNTTTVYAVTGNVFTGVVSCGPGLATVNFLSNNFGNHEIDLSSSRHALISGNSFLACDVQFDGTLEGNTFWSTGSVSSAPTSVIQRLVGNTFDAFGAISLNGSVGSTVIEVRDNLLNNIDSLSVVGNAAGGTVVYFDGNTIVFTAPGASSFSDVSTFNNNLFNGGTLSLAMSDVNGLFGSVTGNKFSDCSLMSCSGAEFVGNTVFSVTVDTVAAVYTDCQISGCEFVAARPLEFHGCLISGSRIQTANKAITFTKSTNLTKPSLTGSHVVSGTANTSFTGTSATNLISACSFSSNISVSGSSQDFYMSDCEVAGTFTTTTSGKVVLGSSRIVGAIDIGSGGAAAYAQLSNLNLGGAISTVATEVLMEGAHVAGVANLQGTAYVQISNSVFANNLLGAALQFTVTGSSVAGTSNIGASATFDLSGCSFVGASAIDAAVGSISGCSFSSVVMATTAIKRMLIQGNNFVASSSGGTLVAPLSIKSCPRGTDAKHGLSIVGNHFLSQNESASVQAPCVSLGVNSSDLITNLVFSDNVAQMTIRGTDPSSPVTVGVLDIQGELHEATISGNHWVRGVDASGVTAFGLNVAAAGGKNVLVVGNTSFSSTFSATPTITYSGDANAKGGRQFFAGTGDIPASIL